MLITQYNRAFFHRPLLQTVAESTSGANANSIQHRSAGFSHHPADQVKSSRLSNVVNQLRAPLISATTIQLATTDSIRFNGTRSEQTTRRPFINSQMAAGFINISTSKFNYSPPLPTHPPISLNESNDWKPRTLMRFQSNSNDLTLK